MKSNNNDATARVPAQLGAAAALTWLIHSAPAGAAEFTVNPELSVAGIYTDNLLLAPAGQEESELVGQLTPGIRAEMRSQRLDGSLDYEMQNYFFSDSERDQTFHQLDGDLQSVLVSELLFFDVTARMAQTIVDPEELVPYSNFIVTENRADFFAYDLNPYLEREIGSFMRARAGFSYGDLHYYDVDTTAPPDRNIQDFTDRVVNLVLTGLPEDRTLGWELRYNDERVEFDDGSAVEYEVAGAELNWRVSSSLELIGRGGVETDIRENQENAELDSEYWGAGFRWNSGDRHELEITAGERFFGDDVQATWRYVGRLLEVGFDYSETPLVVGQQLFQAPVLNAPLPGETNPTLTGITPEVYVSKLGTAWLALNGRRNRIRLSAYQDQREYLASVQDEEELGVLFDWNWRLGPRTTVFSEFTWQRLAFRDSERNDEFAIVTIGAERQIGSGTFVTLTARAAQRTSDTIEPSPLYEESGAILEVRHRFGRPPPTTDDAVYGTDRRRRSSDSVMRR